MKLELIEPNYCGTVVVMESNELLSSNDGNATTQEF